jgi:hypothetical protein
MDAFSYLSVLLSIIIGLGLTQMLTATGRLIHHRRRVRGDWLPLLWAGVLLIIYVQVWWAMFGLRRQAEWSFFAFLVVLAQTVTLYMMAAVALPEQVDEAGLDLAAYYEQQRPWFFGFFLATLLISVLKDVVLGGRLPDPVNLAFHGILGAASLSAILVRGRRYQEIVGVGCAVVIALYIGLLFARLQ